ncbi:MAG TPA: PTS fructose transporter subunit IIA [Hellea balneolensis]|uniref:PTS fructose transporter subunit IIA n=1 Tax=Hellea balneolensis TaxID=287478 RepID=A0A7C3GBJ3_9PROT|nr:PTS fructose transporter subunit IIA [Hellea balneolensis]
MIGLVIVTHGALAQELRCAAEHVVGPMAHMQTVCIAADENLEHASDAIRGAIETVDMGRGVLVLTDMFGGTPSNLSISFLKENHVEVVAGANLPMLIKLSEARETQNLNDAARTAVQAGRHYIAIASEIIAGDD